MAAHGGPRVRALYSCEHWEIVKPSVSELSREVRTNILCTVNGCGKVLPNPPALNMHLVKSHGVQDGITNPTLRKDLKASQKLYCCPIEGCPRGTNRPFSQFSRVKQHFMKMHAEKKHKCDKCGNSYGTEWDLKRHVGYCGKTFRCTCGCPYASRTALLSHTLRMGHEIPVEHRSRAESSLLPVSAIVCSADVTLISLQSIAELSVNCPPREVQEETSPLQVLQAWTEENRVITGDSLETLRVFN